MENSELKESNDDDSKDKLTISDFLEFLKISCQLNKAISNDNNTWDENSFEYNKLVTNVVMKSLNENASKKKHGEAVISNDYGTSPFKKKELHPILEGKLDKILNEGILDSVIPFMCHLQPPVLNATHVKQLKSKHRDVIQSPRIGGLQLLTSSVSKTRNEQALTEPEKSISVGQENSLKHNKRRKSSTSDDKKNDSEVIIHVCDEVKNTSKDFICPQSLLISKMGYFADVTAGQKLEDMDISVHCDIQIFEWLMKWVKKSSNSDSNPSLDPINVIPILVSASFLQMEPLLLDCLSFCHSRLTDVVRFSSNLSCLNDSIVSRLAAMFTNAELEMVKDKKERIIPRLWTKMLQSLCEPEAQALRGHYFSLSSVIRCTKCTKLFTQSASTYINCIPTNMRLNRWGQLLSQHVRDTNWDLSNYTAQLFKELKSWRKVYWRLWGQCHFLYCCICESHFPAYQINWCRYHPENPQFFGPSAEGKIAGPAGRYPCCSQQAFRYEALISSSGCLFREHSVLVENDRDRSILQLVQSVADGGCLCADPPILKTLSNVHEPIWTTMSLLPTKSRQGLFPSLYLEVHSNNKQERFKRSKGGINSNNYDDSSSESDSSDFQETKKIVERNESISSGGSESGSSSPYSGSFKGTIGKCFKTSGRYWCGEVSARSNQDNQREFEEKVMKQIVSLVGKKTGIDLNSINASHHIGGIYVKLESEWKDQLKIKNGSTKGKHK